MLAFGGVALSLLTVFVRGIGSSEREASVAEADDLTGAATTLGSDQPVFDKAGDLLGYAVIVETLSSFVRNAATDPRITIAVSGEWGSGKSSIMRMLQTELMRAGFRTAWFNAWHHQQEGRQLATMFNTIRAQAVPRSWGQPWSALRVRSRLIWGRGVLYRFVAVAVALGAALLTGDLVGRDGLAPAWERVTENLRHYVLNDRPTYLGRDSLKKLDPFLKDRTAEQAPPAKGPSPYLEEIREQCRDPVKVAAATDPLPVYLFCDLALHLTPDSEWRGTGQPSACHLRANDGGAGRERCVFANLANLLRTIEDASGLAKPLTARQRELIAEAAQTTEPPQLFRWLQNSLLVDGLAGILLLLFTKGMSVYGLDLLSPLKGLLARFGNAGEGKEPTGTVERYRSEFKLLCDALDGRLVVFIDDLDRCTPETVNGMLELTNYMVDVGRCFIVIGAALERVKKCVRSPVEADDHDRYASEYLRKLVHVELAVPQRSGELARLIEAQGTRGRSHATRAPWRGALRWGWGVVALAALWSTFEFAQQLQISVDGRASAVARPAAAPTPAVPSTTQGQGSRDPIGPIPTKPRPPDGTGPDVGLDEPPAPVLPWSVLFGVAVLLGLALGSRALWQHREAVIVALGGALRTTDSPRFLGALRLWHEVVAQHDPTPRQVKRFYNRARLQAAYEHEILKERTESIRAKPIDEAAVVAMVAIHHVQPGLLDEMANFVEEADKASGARSKARRSEPHDRDPFLTRVLEEHERTFGALPTPDQIQRFAARLEGIHVR